MAWEGTALATECMSASVWVAQRHILHASSGDERAGNDSPRQTAAALSSGEPVNCAIPAACAAVAEKRYAARNLTVSVHVSFAVLSF